MEIMIFIVTVVAVVMVAVLSHLAEKRRRDELAKVARELDLQFSAKDPFDVPRRLGHLHALKRGSSRRARNVMHGTYRDREVLAFDFRYSRGSGKNRHTYHLSACLVQPGCRFPRLFIRPEGFLDKIGDFLGFDDIDFESDEFSREFRVTSDDRKFAYDVCHVQMMAWLLRWRGWQFELAGGHLCVTDDRKWSPAWFRRALDMGVEFLERIPDFVWREYAAGSAAETIRERDT